MSKIGIGKKEASDAPIYAIDANEYRIQMALQQTVKQLCKKENGIDEIMKTHYLKGTFVKLADPKNLREVLYPGASAEALVGLPSTLKEIIEWPQLELDHTKIIKNAAEVLRNIKSKGAKQGNSMDENTEQILLPQITQEALANHIVECVRKLNCKVSSVVATLAEKVADPTKDEASWHQFDDDVIEHLKEQHLTKQIEYLGKHWTEAIVDDIRRFLIYEKMTYIDEIGNVIVKEIDEVDPSDHIQMCWIEQDEHVKKYYPAVAEAISQLHALPYELNARFPDKGFDLMEASRGCTMLVMYPPLSQQAVRLDCRTAKSNLDSGIRMTAVYHLQGVIPVERRVPSIMDGEQFQSEIVFYTKKKGIEKKTSIPIEDDLLTLHFSSEVKNERTIDSLYNWFALVFFMHGKENTNSNDKTKEDPSSKVG